MALVDALGLYILSQTFNAHSWVIFGITLVVLIVVNIIYFTHWSIPAKYLTPGLVFLLIFQVFVILYTGYIAFTNYGNQHMLSKEAATNAILLNSSERVKGSPTYPLVVVQKGADLGFAINNDGIVQAGTATSPLEDVPGATISGTSITDVPGYTVLTQQQIIANQQAIQQLKVPISQDASEGAIGTQTATMGYVFKSTVRYDEAQDAIIDNKTGEIYKADEKSGSYVSASGDSQKIGWRVNVGFDNFKKAFADPRYATPFLRVLAWTFAFAFLSVATTFLLGMFLAMALNHERVRGRKIYRTLLLLPYAFPSFMTAFLFAGMLNPKYGFINQVLFGGAEIPWLSDPWLARLSVIGVNLWMGFPYMMLICIGALQSIPADLNEAAEIDGASGFQAWRFITLPQLLIQVTPLLISSFAFNFNNFNLIYMLTNGGPQFDDASVPVGATDIMISMVYQISGMSGRATRDYGLASAMSLLIFIIVGTVSMISFARTQKSQEVSV
ncbi:ABC transporter permease subunit [Neoactinobaculum massilliense]|uniref:ABC transporter permease subunit n=1 Tax=Neoactinobaculum massilliense TaxID=2364794 RepID=UPI000F54B73E|nr:ABC transporter permease subunit [Neoactinobaculum massilliense]